MSDAREIVERMVDALNDHVIDGMDEFWSKDMVWRGPAGAGEKKSLREFQEGWQRPFLEAFPDKQAHDEFRIAEGNIVAASGYVSGTHVGEFMGIPGTGRKIKLRYMDFWRVEDGKLVENWVLLDIIGTMRQMGVDVLDGKGWDERGKEV